MTGGIFIKLYPLFQEVLNVEYTHIGEETASYYTKLSGTTLTIYFEWSRGCVDWRNNLDFPAKSYRNMPERWHCHRGFLRVWRSLEATLSPAITDPSVKKIIIAGYSHGGALALFCHEYCMFHRPDLASCISTYAFGAPRVIWGPVPEKVKERFQGFHVIRNRRDIVTHVPPVIFGYRHIGNMYVVGDGGKNPFDAHRSENYRSALAAPPCQP